MTTVSAEAKLIPKPPALVDNRKQKSYKNGQFDVYFLVDLPMDNKGSASRS